MSRPIRWLPPWLFWRIAYLVFYCGTTLISLLHNTHCCSIDALLSYTRLVDDRFLLYASVAYTKARARRLARRDGIGLANRPFTSSHVTLFDFISTKTSFQALGPITHLCTYSLRSWAVTLQFAHISVLSASHVLSQNPAQRDSPLISVGEYGGS